MRNDRGPRVNVHQDCAHACGFWLWSLTVPVLVLADVMVPLWSYDRVIQSYTSRPEKEPDLEQAQEDCKVLFQGSDELQCLAKSPVQVIGSATEGEVFG